MLKISNSSVAVTRGASLVFSAFESDDDMWSGEGPRQATQKVVFEEAFLQPPVVHISINMWDIWSEANARADIQAENVTETGFDIVFRTWGDTRVARIRAEWMAIGPVHNEDDFIGV